MGGVSNVNRDGNNSLYDNPKGRHPTSETLPYKYF